MNYEYLIRAIRVDCTKCESEYIVKFGKTEDGRQIIKCTDCNRKTTLNPKARGQGFSNEKKLLPFLSKPYYSLTKEELYSLGWMISDGTVSKMNALSLSVQFRDREILDIIKKALSIPNSIRTYDRTHENKGIACILSWASKYALKDFERYGLFPNKTGNEIWLPYMRSNHFIRGLFDGDGGFSFINKPKMNGNAHFTCASYKFIQAMTTYLEEVCKAKAVVYQTEGVNAYKLTFSILNADKLGNYLYQDSEGLRLERKYQKYLQIKHRHDNLQIF